MNRDYETIQVRSQDGVVTLCLNRPERRNALNQTMRQELRDLVQAVRDDRDVHALVLTGAGGAFCAGGDLEGIGSAALDNQGWRQRMADLHVWFRDLMLLDKVVIAAVDGAAYGAGFSLALTADFILASPRARFCMSFMRVGVIPDLGALYTLPRVVGPRRARELMLSTREVRAEEALALGIASELVPQEDLAARAQTLAACFAGASPLAVSVIKRAVDASSRNDLHTMLDIEASSQALMFGCDEHREAIQRFLSKQPPRFSWPEQ